MKRDIIWIIILIILINLVKELNIDFRLVPITILLASSCMVFYLIKKENSSDLSNTGYSQLKILFLIFFGYFLLIHIPLIFLYSLGFFPHGVSLVDILAKLRFIVMVTISYYLPFYIASHAISEERINVFSQYMTKAFSQVLVLAHFGFQFIYKVYLEQISFVGESVSIISLTTTVLYVLVAVFDIILLYFGTYFITILFRKVIK